MRLVLAVLGVLVSVSALARAEYYKVDPGPHEVADEAEVWRDIERSRDVPVRLFRPSDAEGELPLIVFSHRLHGSCDDYLFMGRHWASHGYIVVFVEHEGSNRAAAERRATGRTVPGDRGDHRWTRVYDLQFAISEAGRRDGFEIDQERIGVGGQDAGAVAALIMAGARAAVGPDGQTEHEPDDRVRAALAISPPAGKWGMIDRSWEAIDRPVLWMTGTNDYDEIMHSPGKRRQGFDLSGGPGQVLVVLEEGEHDSFTDRDLGPRAEMRDPGFADDVLGITTAFWDAQLLGDEAASAWLASDSAQEASGPGLLMERRE